MPVIAVLIGGPFLLWQIYEFENVKTGMKHCVCLHNNTQIYLSLGLHKLVNLEEAAMVSPHQFTAQALILIWTDKVRDYIYHKEAWIQ